jgi:uncharacterized membrane protein YeaQ/YmgE (transglycosylase-associated protein family)
MGFIVWIVAGALAGWAASALFGTRGRAARILNVAIGITGVLASGWLMGRVIGASAFHPGVFSVVSLLVSLLGVAVLLAVVQECRAIATGHATARLDGVIGNDSAPVARLR